MGNKVLKIIVLQRKGKKKGSYRIKEKEASYPNWVTENTFAVE